METTPGLEREQLESDIANNYRQYKQEPQERTEKGKLLSPIAETFEVRMNRDLQAYKDLMKVAGRMAVGHEVAA